MLVVGTSSFAPERDSVAVFKWSSLCEYCVKQRTLSQERLNSWCC